MPATACTSSTITVWTPASGVAGGRREHQEQRLGGGDQDVGWPGDQFPPLSRRRVAGADADADARIGQAEPLCRTGDAGERRAQVAFDVDGQRLERGNVENPVAVAGLVSQPVDRPQERRERLAGPRRRDDQRVVAVGNGRPCLRLRRRGRGERAGEPLTGGWAEAGERVRDGAHVSIVPMGYDKKRAEHRHRVCDRFVGKPKLILN